jgi:DNA-binding CsgD family transcriptional regulator
VELTGVATDRDVAFLRGRAAQARGAVRLASGDAAGAVADLRLACDAWEEIDAPYELARARVLLGLAFRDLGDRDGARLEFDAAHEVFDRIGARPDSARAAALATEAAEVSGSSLTGREVEVLRLIATGATNRSIAGRLAISEKTVARHISNIFTKLDLPSRAAATAYAYEHKIV